MRTTGGRPSRWIALAAVALVVPVLGACQPPVRDSRDYRLSAARAAGDAANEVATAELGARLSQEQRATVPYLVVLLGRTEDSLSSIQDGFAGLQPPTPADADVRTAVLDLLQQAGEQAQQVRVDVLLGRLPSTTQTRDLLTLQQRLDDAAGGLSR